MSEWRRTSLATLTYPFSMDQILIYYWTAIYWVSWFS